MNQFYGEWKQLTQSTHPDTITCIPVTKEVGDDPMESSVQEDDQDAQAVAENAKESKNEKNVEKKPSDDATATTEGTNDE